jgi:hypothetical protein
MENQTTRLDPPYMSGCVSTPTHAAYDAASIMSSCACTYEASPSYTGLNFSTATSSASRRLCTLYKASWVIGSTCTSVAAGVGTGAATALRCSFLIRFCNARPLSSRPFRSTFVAGWHRSRVYIAAGDSYTTLAADGVVLLPYGGLDLPCIPTLGTWLRTPTPQRRIFDLRRLGFDDGFRGFALYAVGTLHVYAPCDVIACPG